MPLRVIPAAGTLALVAIVGVGPTATGPVAAAKALAPTKGLVLAYTFDSDSATRVRDASSHALDAPLVNGSLAAAHTTSVAGHGKALLLKGASHQYLAVPEKNALDVNRYTLAARVDFTGVQNDKTFDRWEVLEKAGAYWLNIRTDGRVRAGGFFGSCTRTSAWKYLDSTTVLRPNTWTHVASTYDGSRLTIWVNGKRAGRLGVTGRTCVNDEPLAIGAKNAPAKGLLEAFYDGRLDDVRIYNRALSAAEVATLAR
jgi:hypothetical protein